VTVLTLEGALDKKLTVYSTPEKQAHLGTYDLSELALVVHGGFNVYRYNAPSGPLSLEEIPQRGLISTPAMRSGMCSIGFGFFIRLIQQTRRMNYWDYRRVVGGFAGWRNFGRSSVCMLVRWGSDSRFSLGLYPSFGLPLMSEKCCIFRTFVDLVRKMRYISDKRQTAMKKPKGSELKTHVLQQILAAPGNEVWTASDFTALGSRSAIDKALQRSVATGDLRRIDRGLYDRPTKNELTGKPTVPDYRAVIRAVARRDKVRLLVDGMTAANDLGLTTAVPARIEVLVDARLKPIRIGNLVIHFRTAAPSRLFWAGRPAMRVVQALYWMQDILSRREERGRTLQKLQKILADKDQGEAIREDLQKGSSGVPIWMQPLISELLAKSHPGSSVDGVRA